MSLRGLLLHSLKVASSPDAERALSLKFEVRVREVPLKSPEPKNEGNLPGYPSIPPSIHPSHRLPLL